MTNFKHKRVVIVGYPLGTHTHSYAHHGMYRAFKKLGFDTYWIDASGWHMGSLDGFSFDDALVFTERNAGIESMPLVKSSTYAIHYVGNKPGMDITGRFLGKVGRLIDIRFNSMYKWDDNGYSYDMSQLPLEDVVPGLKFEKNADYDRVYMNWSTDLLPDEFNLDDRFIPREKKVHYLGTIGGGKGGIDDCLDTNPYYDNRPFLSKFRDTCLKEGVEFASNCPWLSPLKDEEVKTLTQRSWIAPDVRMQAFLDWGYIPDRVFKNISYGQMGVTNSRAVQDYFNGMLIYSDNPSELFYMAQDKMHDYNLILDQMKFVQENHTYLHRAIGLLKVVNDV